MALFLLCIYIAMLGARLNWLFDLFSHFRIQFAFGAFLLTVLLVWLKSEKYAVLTLIPLLASLFDIFRYGDFTTQNYPHKFTVVQYNHLYKNSQLDVVQSWLKKNSSTFDVVILQEATPATVKMVEKLKPIYPYQIIRPQKDAFGMVMISKHPFQKSDIITVKGSLFENFMFRAEIDLGSQNITVFALHALPPMGSLRQSQRNTELASASKIIAEDKSSLKIFAGDWNITPYSPYFQDVLKVSGLHHKFKGFNPGASWPQNIKLPLCKIPIDQVLFSDGLYLENRKIGPAMGSDHAPVIASFGY